MSTLLPELEPLSTATATGPLTVARAAALEPLRDEWNALAGEIPFRRYDWLAPWWTHFREPGDELLLLTVRDTVGALVGLAPFFIRRRRLEGTVVRLLGTGRVCSDYLTVLAAPGQERSVAAALADWLRDEGPRYDRLELDATARDDRAAIGLAAALAGRNHHVAKSCDAATWRLPLPADWQSYVKSLSRTRRQRTRQLVRNLFETDRAVVHVADSPESLARGLEILADLHQRRRRSLGDEGLFAADRFRAFLDEAAHLLHDAGRLRMQWIELEGRPVAAQFDLLGDDTVYYYQSGMDPDAAAARPGWLGVIAALRRAIDEGRTTYDFLRGDEPYKAHWRACRQPLVTWRAIPDRALSRLRYGGLTTARRLGRWVKVRLAARR